MSDNEEFLTLLRWMIRRDFAHEALFFEERNTGRLMLHLNVSDVFCWGCADSEELRLADLPEFERAMKDLEAAGDSAYAYVEELFVARKRKECPQAPLLEKFSEPIRKLFIEAGDKFAVEAVPA